MAILSSSSSLADSLAANWLNVLITAIVILGGGGGIISWFRLRNQNSKILVDAAQGAVVVQSSVIRDLKNELEDQKRKAETENAELKAEIAELRTHLAEVNSLRTRIRDVEQQNEILVAENIMLKSQVKALSKMVQEQEERRNGQREHT